MDSSSGPAKVRVARPINPIDAWHCSMQKAEVRIAGAVWRNETMVILDKIRVNAAEEDRIDSDCYSHLYPSFIIHALCFRPNGSVWTASSCRLRTRRTMVISPPSSLKVSRCISWNITETFTISYSQTHDMLISNVEICRLSMHIFVSVARVYLCRYPGILALFRCA